MGDIREMPELSYCPSALGGTRGDPGMAFSGDFLLCFLWSMYSPDAGLTGTSSACGEDSLTDVFGLGD